MVAVEQHDAPRTMVTEDMNDQGFDFVGFLMRRKWLIIFGSVAGLSMGYMYFVRQPEVFESGGQMVVVKEMAQRPIAGGQQIDYSLVRQNHLATDTYLIRSAAIVGPAVEDNNLAELPTLSRTANPVDAIINGLKVDQIDSSANILQIKFAGPVPDDCGKIINAVMKSYRKYLEEAYQNVNQDTKKLLTNARDELLVDLKEAELKRSQLQQQGKLLMEGDDTVNQHELHVSELDAKIAELRIVERTIESDLESINKAMQRGGSLEALRLLVKKTTQAEGNDASASSGASFGRELFPLLVKEADLLQRHGPEHPEVESIRRQIEMTRRFLQEELGSLQSGTNSRSDFLTVYVESQKLELEATKDKIRNMELLLNEEKSKALTLAATKNEDRQLAKEIERLDALYQGVLTKLKDSVLGADSGGYHAEVFKDAGRGYQIAPNMTKILTLGGLLGMLAGLLLGYAVEVADQSFKSPEEISHLLNLQIIGHCPLITASQRPRSGSTDISVDPSLVTYYRPKSRAAEAFRAIRTALYFSTRGAQHKVIQVTSPNPGDGKSTLISNVAVTIAQSGKRVLLIDADFRRPRVHKLFGIKNDVGMSSAILGEIDIMDAIQSTPVANLDCLACGPRPDNPSELLTQARFEELLNMLREKYDFVLVDTPPVLAVTDPSAVAPRVDGVLVCIRVNNKSRLDAVRATELLTQIDANILGIVVNGIDAATRSKYAYGSRGNYRPGHMYGYGYGYGYGSGYGGDGGNASHNKYFADDRESVTPTGNGNGSRRQPAPS